MAIAKLDIVCTECGVTFQHRREKRNRTEADQYIEWARDNITICPDCYHKAQEAEKEAKIEAFISGHDLPELIGSEKQVTWAEKIRRKRMDDCRKMEQERGKPLNKRFWGLIEKASAARFWIDTRDMLPEEFLRELTTL